jgi:molybdate transport system ATP-binding protein
MSAVRDAAVEGTTARSSGLLVDGAVHRGDFRLALSTTVRAGEVVAVLGPNGAGKTTLLRVLAGLVPLSEGRIELSGEVLDDADDGTFVPPERRRVGLVFQDYRLFPHLDVRDNVAFGPRSAGAGRSAARAAAAVWLSRLDLDALAARRPAELSGGQAQRVALARALATQPRLLLLDEPLAALDARTRLDVRSRLRRHLRDVDGPVLVVTHDPLEAMVLADRLLVVEGGAVVQDGSPADVARRPATQYVAQLVGLNLYAGSLAGDGTVRLNDGGVLHVAAPETAAGRVLVVLRPSAVTVHASHPGPASPRNLWPGVVGSMEQLADRVRLQVDGAPPVLVDVTAAAVAELRLEPGRQVWLSAKATETEAYPEAALSP